MVQLAECQSELNHRATKKQTTEEDDRTASMYRRSLVPFQPHGSKKVWRYKVESMHSERNSTLDLVPFDWIWRGQGYSNQGKTRASGSTWRTRQIIDIYVRQLSTISTKCSSILALEDRETKAKCDIRCECSPI